VSRRFATWANVRCGIGIVTSPSLGDGAAGATGGRRRQLASVPPLPPTLDAEGAAQPFGLEIVASQASS